MPSIFYRLLPKIELLAPVKCVSDGGCCFGWGDVSRMLGVCFCLFLLPAHLPHSPIEWQQGKVLFSVILGEGWTVQMLSKELHSVVFDEAMQLSACG